MNAHESPFYIDKYAGVIRVNGRLDYEMKTQHSVQIVASDGKFAATCILDVQLRNLVDKAPYFEYTSYSFRLKVPTDVYIGQLKAVDVEHTANLSYALEFGKPADARLFCVSQTGVLYLCSSVVPSLGGHKLAALSNDADNFLSEFTESEYVFNVSVSVYSADLMSELVSRVECRIQIEATQTTSPLTHGRYVQSNFDYILRI